MSATIPVDPDWVLGFLLVLVRTSAWAVASPLFGNRALPGVGRLSAGVALAVLVHPLVQGQSAPTDTAGFVTSVGVQALVGLTLGLVTALLIAAVETAGHLADLISGFSYGALLDPVSGSQSAAFARLANFTALALLFVTGAFTSILGGFVDSFRAIPLNRSAVLASGSLDTVLTVVRDLMVGALQIGAPLLGVLFLTDVGLGLAARLVPQANFLSVGLPLKALVALSAAGTLFVLLPGHIAELFDQVPSTTNLVTPTGVLGG